MTKFKDKRGKVFDTQIEALISDYSHTLYWFWENNVPRHSDALTSKELVTVSINNAEELSEIAERLISLKKEYKEMTGKDFVVIWED